MHRLYVRLATQIVLYIPLVTQTIHYTFNWLNRQFYYSMSFLHYSPSQCWALTFHLNKRVSYTVLNKWISSTLTSLSPRNLLNRSHFTMSPFRSVVPPVQHSPPVYVYVRTPYIVLLICCSSHSSL